MINRRDFITIADAPPKITEQSLGVFKRSGIKFFVAYPDDDNHYETLEKCRQLGIDVFVFGGSVVCDSNRSVFKNAIGNFPNYWARYETEGADLNDYENVKGLYIIDEPGANLFDDMVNIYVPWHNKNFVNKKLWHVNLLPSYASAESQLGVMPEKDKSAFEVYVDKYVEQVLSKVKGIKTLGVDHYPMREKGGKLIMSDDWINDIAIVGEAAKRANAIYSVCIQCYYDQDIKIMDCTADIRIQVYCALAFGASMFEIYAYSSKDGKGTMTDGDGNPTLRYYAVRDVLSEIDAFKEQYLARDLVGTKFFTANGKIEPAFEKAKNRQIEKFSNLKDVSVTQNTIISEYTDGNKAGYLIVNYGIPALTKSNLVDLKLDGCESITLYRYGRKEIVPVENGKICLLIEAGQGVFLVLN